MKRPGLSRCLPSATLFLAATAAGVTVLPAQEIRPADPILLEPITPEQARTVSGPVAQRSFRDELLERFDRNHDGRIDDEERIALDAFLRAPATPGGESDRLALARLIRAAVEADAALRRRFDTDQDGTLSDPEWMKARRILAQTLQEAPPFGPPASRPGMRSNPASPDEQRRLDAVAAELARRRKERAAALGSEAKTP